MTVRQESLDIVSKYISQGFKAPATWTWKKLAEEVLTSEGVQCGDRLSECAENAERILKGYYPNRDKSWDAAFVTVSDDLRKMEFTHVVEATKFSADFTLKNRPVPPPKPKKEKPEGAPIPPPPAAGDIAPPAPPAPPAPAVPAPPPPG